MRSATCCSSGALMNVGNNPSGDTGVAMTIVPPYCPVPARSEPQAMSATHAARHAARTMNDEERPETIMSGVRMWDRTAPLATPGPSIVQISRSRSVRCRAQVLVHDQQLRRRILIRAHRLEHRVRHLM